MINIITRLSRKNSFKNKLLPSLKSQTFQNYHHVITYSSKDIRDFVEPYVDKDKTTFCKVFPQRKLSNLHKGINYNQENIFDKLEDLDPRVFDEKKEQFNQRPDPTGSRVHFSHFPFNLYHIKAESKLKPGWVIYLDDDDTLYDNISLEILNNFATDPDTLYFYRFFMKGVGPDETALRHSLNDLPPALGTGFCGASFTFHTKYLDYTNWDEWSGADWRTCQSLWYNVKNVSLIDKIIQNISDEPGLGEVKPND